jgi:hypothetical protein
MESEKPGFDPNEAHDLGSAAKVREGLRQEIERLEQELDSQTLNPEQIRDKKTQLAFLENNTAKLIQINNNS